MLVKQIEYISEMDIRVVEICELYGDTYQDYFRLIPFIFVEHTQIIIAEMLQVSRHIVSIG